MSDADLDRYSRAAVSWLRDLGIAEDEVLGVLRAGALLRGALEETAEAQQFRAWLETVPAGVPDPSLPLTRYLRTARQHLAVIVAWWSKAEDLMRGDQPVLGALWASLDRVEGERLAERVLVESA